MQLLNRALLIVVSLAGCDCARPAAETALAETATGDETVGPEGCATDVPRLPEPMQQGVCYAHNYQERGARGYGTPVSRRSRGELSALGVEWLSLTPFSFMRSIDSPEVRLIGHYVGGETDDVMGRELSAASRDGFSVLLKPHISIQGGSWRGDIEMDSDADWRTWFVSYAEFILHYARMAQRHAVPILTVGVELDHTTIRFEDQWRALLGRVREIYDGELVYSANWDRVDAVPIFDAVDYVGVQFYPPLAPEEGASYDALCVSLRQRFEGLGVVSRRVGKPVILTEVGYRSVPHASVRPHEWPERDEAPVVDHREQARIYRALMTEVAAHHEFIAGVYLWKWFTDPESREEGPDGFSPRGKPAEAIVRAAYGGTCSDPR